MSSPVVPVILDDDVPQTIIVALNLVQSDSDSLAANQTTAGQAQTALVAAQTTASTANSVVQAATTQLATDQAALVSLIASTYTPAAQVATGS